MLIDSIFLPAAQRRLGAIIADVCAGPATATLPLRALSGGNQIGSATMMLMPLPDGYGETTRIFGAALTPPVPTARPVRFDFDPAQKLTFEPLESERPNRVSRPALRLVVDNG